jgi:hypothetical protein
MENAVGSIAIYEEIDGVGRKSRRCGSVEDEDPDNKEDDTEQAMAAELSHLTSPWVLLAECVG